MPPRKPPVDLTAANAGSNPSKIIHDNYKMLMEIPDPDQLMQTVVNLVKPTLNHGFSPKNYQTFMRNLQQSSMKGLEGIQFFLTNFMLKGGGLGVAENKIDAIASLICEGTIGSVPLTNEQRKMKLLAESYGFNVIVLEGNTREVESYVFYRGDGPVTGWVALVRTLELVAQGKIGPDAAAEFMTTMNIIDVSSDHQVDADSEYMS